MRISNLSLAVRYSPCLTPRSTRPYQLTNAYRQGKDHLTFADDETKDNANAINTDCIHFSITLGITLLGEGIGYALKKP
ncbi:hypothetical protein PoB_001207200 [Plakobranchus ocellatus]|uniref:Uncharacterized protein n=1 Tax=Plakobranchus ocellatus TaxID=259542 RepID=A0AAV3YTW1_9GAST|nr:hypothetical protein PoB_001207200 [Plakobranchus ocellatus]